jgi:hypothetical protein
MGEKFVGRLLPDFEVEWFLVAHDSSNLINNQTASMHRIMSMIKRRVWL